MAPRHNHDIVAGDKAYRHGKSTTNTVSNQEL